MRMDRTALVTSRSYPRLLKVLSKPVAATSLKSTVSESRLGLRKRKFRKQPGLIVLKKRD